MTRLGDVCEKIGSGATPRGGKEAYKDAGIPIIRSQNIHDWVFQPDGLAFLDDEQAESLSNVEVRSNDVLLNITGDSVARACIVPSERIPARVNQHVAIVRAGKEINPTYLLASLQSKKTTLLSLASSGATRNALTKRMIENLDIDLPSREMQDSIAQVLDSFQYKITLNNRLNDYLLEVGEMRFADLETRGTLSKTVHIADLPHILETGKRPKGGAASCGIPSVGAENVKKLGEFNYSSNKYIPRTFADNLKKGRVNGYELMIYKDGGRPGQFIPHFSMFGEGYPYKEFYINEHVFKLDFGDRGLNEFAYYYFHTPYVMKWLETNGTKAAIPGINRQNIEELEFPDPEQESVQDFCKRIQPYFTAIFRNCLENKQLQSLRDTLLPRLMSGEIDVSKVDLTQLTNNHLSDC